MRVGSGLALACRCLAGGVGVGVLLLWVGASGCTGAYEGAVRRELATYREHRPRQPVGVVRQPSQEQAPLTAGVASNSGGGGVPDGRLTSYLARALAREPGLAAAFARFEASVARIARARRLPEPTLSFGYFLQSVETRVGPQRARVSIQQSLPWPTKFTAGADAASAQARAAQRRFEALSLGVTAAVAAAYWDLWQVRRTRVIHRDHLVVLQSLAEAVHGRLATGGASLAEQLQVDLAVARLEDVIAGLDEAERSAQARLELVTGAVGDDMLATADDPPEACMPALEVDGLRDLAVQHPNIAVFGLLAQAHQATARVEAAERLPSFTVGADWLVTGTAQASGVEDSGKDAVMVGLGLRLPIFQGSYGASVAAAEAESRAERKSQEAAKLAARAELTQSLASLRDAVRRVKLQQRTLLPQAEAVFESVLGAYTAGRGGVAQLLLAQRDLLELHVALQQARADYARAWARLEFVVGQGLQPAAACAAGTFKQGEAGAGEDAHG